MHHSRIFLFALLGFLGGVALASWIVLLPVLWWLALLVGGMCLCARRPILLAAGTVLIAAVLGGWRIQLVLERPAPVDIGQHVTLDGVVVSDSLPTKNGIQYLFQTAVGDTILIFGPDTIKPRYGQILELSGTLKLSDRISADDARAVLSYPQYSVPLDWRPSWPMRAEIFFYRRIASDSRCARELDRPLGLAA